MLRFHVNFIMWVKDDSKKSHTRCVDQQWFYSFDGGGKYTKETYDKLQEFQRLYVATIEPLGGRNGGVEEIEAHGYK